MNAPAFTDVGLPTQPAVVFLHGVGGGRHGWAAQQTHLAALGWRSLAWDMPGYGDSPMVTPYDFAQLAQALWQMLDAAHIDQAVLVGHSMGAMVASPSLLPKAGLLAASSRPRMRSGFCVQACWQMLDAAHIDQAVLVGHSMGAMVALQAWSMCAASSICQRACARCAKS